MLLKKLFPYVLAACFAAGIFPALAPAQSLEKTQPRQLAQSIAPYNQPGLDNESVIVSFASAKEDDAAKSSTAKGGINFQFKNLITAAIDERLGSRYSWGATGPSAFDCSGFVWSTFRSAGIDFERGSTRALWTRFTAPAPEDQFEFGTLVFFSGLAHVGIVADEHGFYHASRHHGVVYSPFNEYWMSRIDGFRRIPLPVQQTTD